MAAKSFIGLAPEKASIKSNKRAFPVNSLIKLFCGQMTLSLNKLVRLSLALIFRSSLFVLTLTVERLWMMNYPTAYGA